MMKLKIISIMFAVLLLSLLASYVHAESSFNFITRGQVCNLLNNCGFSSGGNGTSGENPFNQVLNITSNVTFNKITTTGESNLNSYKIARVLDVTATGTDPLFTPLGKFSDSGAVYIDVQEYGCNLGQTNSYYIPLAYDAGYPTSNQRVFEMGNTKLFPNTGGDHFVFYYQRIDGSNFYLGIEDIGVGCGAKNVYYTIKGVGLTDTTIKDTNKANYRQLIPTKYLYDGYESNAIIGGTSSIPQVYITQNDFVGIRINNSAGCTDCSFVVGNGLSSPTIASFRVDGTDYSKFTLKVDNGNVDEKLIQMYNNGAGYYWGFVNDAENYEQYFAYFTRSGTTPTGAYLGGGVQTNGAYSTLYYSGVGDCYDSALGGQICTDGGIVYSITDDPSDIKFKDNIIPLVEDKNKINLLSAKSWDWDIIKTGKGYGFVAQEVEAVYPEFVKIGQKKIPYKIEKTREETIYIKQNVTRLINDTNVTREEDVMHNELKKYNVTLWNVTTYKTIDYSGLIGTLWENVKEQKTEIEDLQNRIILLESKIK